VVLRGLDAGDVERFVESRAGSVRDDLSVAHADHPGACRMALRAAHTTAHSAATGHQDTVAEVPVLVTLWLQHVPELPGLGEVQAYAPMAAVSAALDAGPRQRQELHICVIEPEQRVDVPGTHRLEALPDEFNVLGHSV
jgi:hypothetical protein